VCDFIIGEAKKNPNLEVLGVTWFGGEPLLFIDAISYMSDRIKGFCKAKSIGYSAGIVTNGRFLNRSNAEVLLRCGVNRVQLSMDGMPETYIAQKRAKPGDFEAVVDNIVSVADMIPITVRINVSDNEEEAFELTRYLLENRCLNGRIKIYAAHVRDYSEGCSSAWEREAHSRYLSFAQEYQGLFTEDGPYSPSSYSYAPPKRRCTTCLSVCSSNYCVGPKGELYRCEHHFGKESQIVGTVRDGRYFADLDLRYLQYRHLKDCEDCVMLPICLGGCMNDTKDGENMLSCELFRKYLVDSLFFGIENGS